MATPATARASVFIGPGLSPFKRLVTLLGVIFLLALVLWIAFSQGILQGGSAVGSTIVAVLFILGFLYYLRLIAPVPFTIRLSPEALIRENTRGEVVEVGWEQLSRVREEFFSNGKRISLAVYRQPASPEQKARAWAVYRDDVHDIDALAEALKAAIPASCVWQSETVHD